MISQKIDFSFNFFHQMEAPKEPSQPPLPEMDEKRDISKEDNPVLHVIVVGFHHKKGCLVNYSYPPLLPDGDG